MSPSFSVSDLQSQTRDKREKSPIQVNRIQNQINDLNKSLTDLNSGDDENFEAYNKILLDENSSQENNMSIFDENYQQSHKIKNDFKTLENPKNDSQINLILPKIKSRYDNMIPKISNKS